MRDMFGDEREQPKDLASENRARDLIKYLNTRKEPQDAHAGTVMAFVTQKAAANHRIRTLEMELDRYRMRDMDRHMNGSGETSPHRVLPIPADVRSVEVKF